VSKLVQKIEQSPSKFR